MIAVVLIYNYFCIDLPAPSTFGVVWHKHVSKHGMLLHRPDPEMYGTHITLYFKGFGEFCQLYDTVEIDANDTTFVTKLVMKMGKKYDSEAERRDMFCDAINDYISPLTVVRQTIGKYFPDGVIMRASRTINLILEVKNEIGTGANDSLMEAVAYYFHSNEDQEFLPCFIVDLVGPHIGIYGAITVSNKIQIDKLCLTHWLCFQPNDKIAMLQIAKLFKALRTVLQGKL